MWIFTVMLIADKWNVYKNIFTDPGFFFQHFLIQLKKRAEATEWWNYSGTTIKYSLYGKSI